MTQINQLTDDMVLGFWDTDGSIVLERENRPGKTPAIRVRYSFGQSALKKDFVIRLAKEFGGVTYISATDATFITSARKPVGQRLRALLQRNKPLNPGRRRDYLISEVILNYQEANSRSKVERVAMFFLAFQITVINLEIMDHTPISVFIDALRPTPSELEQGRALAQQHLDVIDAEVAQLRKDLPTLVLSTDYLAGAHVGDGGLVVALSWRPTKSNRRRTETEWTVSGADYDYCSAFRNTMQAGRMNLTAPNCYSFRIGGLTNCLRVVEMFKPYTCMPQAKKDQLANFEKAIKIVQQKRHFTIEGTTEILDLVWDLGEKGGRKGTKDQYLNWGTDWLRKNGYV